MRTIRRNSENIDKQIEIADVTKPDDDFRRIIDEGKCIGCGLCSAIYPEKLKMSLHRSGYLRPRLDAPLVAEDVENIYSVCPGVVQSGLPDALLEDDTCVDDMWGPLRRIEKVHAADTEVRHRGATSGSLTALAQYLIESGATESVLHIAPGGENPCHGHAQMSETGNAVKAAAGSCYAPAAPLTMFIEMLDKGEPFAVVAKPCDISAVRLYAEHDSRVGKLVTHCLTMVCGGIMPPFGMNAFLERNGQSLENVASVSYRGNGCPGPTRVELNDGTAFEASYLEFWGTDASMWHLPWRCKICPDGNGEAADIAVADTWPGGSPTEESARTDLGTNALVARSGVGEKLLQDALNSGYLATEGPATVADLSHWQPHQIAKKLSCEARFEGLIEAGQMGIKTVALRTEFHRQQMTEENARIQIDGTIARISIGKHRDDFGVDDS